MNCPELELPAVEKRIRSLRRAVELGQAAEGPVETTIHNLLMASALYHERKRGGRLTVKPAVSKTVDCGFESRPPQRTHRRP